MASGHYILDENNQPVEEPNLIKWGRWMERPLIRVVDKTEINGLRISTVFLGIDHADCFGRPILFETMIFGNDLGEDEYQTRCSSYSQAQAMHKKACDFVRTKEPGDGTKPKSN